MRYNNINYISEYSLFFFLFILSTLIAFLLIGLSFFFQKINKKKNIIDTEKLSAYECGFDPFEEARLQFNVYYYVIGILFLIFDIEIIYLFPCLNLLPELTNTSIIAIIYFLIILSIGFLYEWAIGALKW